MRNKRFFNNIELWERAKLGYIKNNDIFEDQEGNQIIYTGISFQVWYTSLVESEIYIGLCKNDLWEYIGNEEDLNEN